MKEHGIEISYLFDNFSKKKERFQIPIYTVAKAEEIYSESPFYAVITTPRFCGELRDELEGFMKREDILCFECELYTSYIHDIGEYRDYLKANENRLEELYRLLWDDKSKRTLTQVIAGRLSADYSWFKSAYVPDQYYPKDIVTLGVDGVFLDVGAYIGDTLDEIERLTEGHYRKIYCLEPDAECIAQLKDKVSRLNKSNIIMVGKGAWNKKETLGIIGDAEHGASKISVSDSCLEQICLDKIDNMIEPGDRVTHIKMDIEGAEYNALLGAKETIRRDKPTLAICVYHKNEDILDIPQLIKGMVPEYRLYLRHHNISGTETVLYAML